MLISNLTQKLEGKGEGFTRLGRGEGDFQPGLIIVYNLTRKILFICNTVYQGLAINIKLKTSNSKLEYSNLS